MDWELIGRILSSHEFQESTTPVNAVAGPPIAPPSWTARPGEPVLISHGDKIS